MPRGAATVALVAVVALALVVEEPLLRVVLAPRREPDLIGLHERALEHDVLLELRLQLLGPEGPFSPSPRLALA